MQVDLNGRNLTSKSFSRGRNLESKRARGEASCAECRRLKLRCDKRAPCSSCVRRGCQIICPNGSLTGGFGSRFVLANTDRLHSKLLEMSKRIRQLEDALQISHASQSPTTHPLLTAEQLSIKSGVDLVYDEATSGNDPDGFTDGISGELGTLTISESGEACFMGRGSSEALLMVMNDSSSEQPTQEEIPIHDPHIPSILPDQVNLFSDAFPFSADVSSKTGLLQTIEAHLPSFARATALAEAYLTNIAWIFIVIDREQIFEELLPAIYKHHESSSGKFDDNDIVHECHYAHRLALLYGVLAAGAAGDLTLPTGDQESEVYYKLARAALGLKSVFDGASMETVQAVLMLSIYNLHIGKGYSLEPTWKVISFGLTLASSIGLHRDPARWQMGPKMVQRRRRLFWEIFFIDKWKSLESGRPAIFNMRELDCEFPEDKEATVDDHGNIVPGVLHWKYQFIKEVLAPIAEQLCQVRRKYCDILELDRKLREFATHPSLSLSSASFDGDVSASMQRYNWAITRETALLFVHRSFFARAMLENPAKPIGSPFASSLLSAYASAITLLKLLRIYFEKHPDMLLRRRVVWANGLTSAVIVGCVACRGPSTFVGSTALAELEATVELFKKAQVHPVPRRALPFLLNLLQRARDANQPAPKNAGIARQELNLLGGVPIFLNKVDKRSSISRQTKVFVECRQSADIPGLQTNPHVMIHSVPSSSTEGSSWPSQEHYRSTPTYLSGFVPYNDDAAMMTDNFDQAYSTALSSISIPTSNNITQEDGSSGINAWDWNTPDITSTSWLEELSNHLPAGFGQGDFNGSNAANLEFLLGTGVQSASSDFPRPEPGDDPVIAEAWRSLLSGS